MKTLKQLDTTGVTELATQLGLSKCTVHDHLATLKECGRGVYLYRARGEKAVTLDTHG